MTAYVIALNSKRTRLIEAVSCHVIAIYSDHYEVELTRLCGLKSRSVDILFKIY